MRRATFAVFACTVSIVTAQPPQGRGGPENESIRQATQLDLDGKGADARAILQRTIDSSATPAAKANGQRAVAMSWAFEGNCKKTAEYEDLVIDYWKTQEKAAPGTAFYQEGEMADEAARVCIDNGDLNTARVFYRKGYDLGMKEPDIPAGRKALWEYRWENAQARLAARTGDKAEAAKHATAATAVLDRMKQADENLYRQQSSFQPYLNGYVALYTGDYKTALQNLQAANQNDAFIQCLIGMTYEKLGEKSKAMDAYRKAAEARGHNPPAAFARPYARKKLGEG